jgi:hypothetical protein
MTTPGKNLAAALAAPFGIQVAFLIASVRPDIMAPDLRWCAALATACGFVFIVRAFGRRAPVIAVIYFPIMYAAVLAASRLLSFGD